MTPTESQIGDLSQQDDCARSLLDMLSRLIVYRAFVLLEFVKKTKRSRLSTLKLVSRNLQGLRFVTLSRPQVPYGDPPTMELIDWVTKLYCFSVLCHFRALLKSLVLLTEAKHAPAVFIIARSLYEIGAHSYYVQKHIKQYRQAKNAGQAWKFMESVNMGSLYMNQKSATASPSRPFPEPRDIGKIIRCFDEWPQNKRPGHASETYSYLSEFAHPNMAAFEHYYEMASTGDNIFVRFINPNVVVKEPLGNVTIAVAAMLYNVSELLDLLGENALAEKLNHSLNILIRS